MSALLDRDFLIRNMTFLYRVIVASAPLLDFAIKRSEGELKAYYVRHLEEEIGHDEMLLDDMRALGVETIPHDYAAAQIAGAQYYFIAHFHPALLLGYMMVLESRPFSLTQIEEVEAAHGSTLTALRHHSKHDAQHLAELTAMRANLTPELRVAVDWNAQCVRESLNAEFARWAHA